MKRIEYNNGGKIGECIFINECEPHIGPSGRENRVGLFKCKCGLEFKTLIESVKANKTTSCGCLREKLNKNILKTHGLSRTPIYKIWSRIKGRCLSKTNPRYIYYGGRGITICDDWRDDFKAFYDYVITLPNAMKEGYTIDRIDNDGNYEPGNIRWADKHTQGANRRSSGGEGGYIGVFKNYKKYSSKITIRGKVVFIGSFNTPREAAIHRDKYIIDNKLSEYPTQIINK